MPNAPPGTLSAHGMDLTFEECLDGITVEPRNVASAARIC